jgi:hypothetical protein
VDGNKTPSLEELRTALSELEAKRQKKDRWSKLRKYFPSAALIISIISLLFTLYSSSSLGSVTLLEPSGYGIVRGIYPPQTDDGESSTSPRNARNGADHLFVPVEWRNNSGGTILIKEPRLVLVNEAGDNFPFFLLGEYPNIDAVFQDHTSYTLTNTFVLKPHAVTQNIAVFRIADSWAKENPEEYLRFHEGERYKVYAFYKQTPHNLSPGTAERFQQLFTS